MQVQVRDALTCPEVSGYMYQDLDRPATRMIAATVQARWGVRNKAY